MNDGRFTMTKPERHNRIPLTAVQLQMWLMDQITSVTPAYGLTAAYRIIGDLDVAALETSFNNVIQRHEILRTTFALNDGEPQQYIHSECKIKIVLVPLDQIP